MIRLIRPNCPNPAALQANDYKNPVNKEALRQASHGKCMYCESLIPQVTYAHIEHIKPKAPGRFPHLMYTWTNLGYACPVCNTEKGDKYHDAYPYIDPYSENPGDHLLAFGTSLLHKNGSIRGQLTIADIKLNRAELMEKRKTRIDDVQNAIDALQRISDIGVRQVFAEKLLEQAASNREYSIFVTALLRAHELVHI